MATLEELTVEATTEIENAKPLYKQVNNERMEFSEADYDQAITDLANSKYDEQENGYKRARQEAYPSIPDQLDMLYWDKVNDTTTWKDAIAEVKADNPKPS
tara:strand:+ start:450 stop:752 length:303 start_codon:yes stop_codon:yes gene_type:complete